MTAKRKFVFLGTGTSVGVPMLGCTCAVCRSTDPRNQRTRCSVVVQLPEANLLIDTSPELRLQLLRERIRLVHAVLFTHYHADHLFGLDDIRPLCTHLGGPMPIYCTAEVEAKIRQVFAYAFAGGNPSAALGYVPNLQLQRIAEEPFTVCGQRIQPIPLEHAQYDVLGFRIDDVAYCTDVSRIPEHSWPLLRGLRVLVLDALRFKPHPAHFSLNQALDVIRELGPERAYLTHMSHELEHVETNRMLPKGVELAYDGLTFDF